MSIIDLNNEEKQSAQYQPIPPMSRVLVRLTINYPDNGRNGTQYPLTSSRSSSLEFLSTSLEVVSPSFRGQKIRHNFNLVGGSTEGHSKAINISRKQIRALVEANSGIHPDDNSPQAVQARKLNAWTDLEGMTFPVTVDCEVSNNNGKQYVNNVLKNIVTVEDSEFAMLRNGGESITDKPLPSTAPAQATPVAPAPTWAAPAAPATPAQPAARPAWSQPAATAAAPAAPQGWTQPAAPGAVPPPPPSMPGQMAMWGSESRAVDQPF